MRALHATWPASQSPASPCTTWRSQPGPCWTLRPTTLAATSTSPCQTTQRTLSGTRQVSGACSGPDSLQELIEWCVLQLVAGVDGIKGLSKGYLVPDLKLALKALDLPITGTHTHALALALALALVLALAQEQKPDAAAGTKPVLRQRLLDVFGLTAPAPVPADLLHALRKHKLAHPSWTPNKRQRTEPPRPAVLHAPMRRQAPLTPPARAPARPQQTPPGGFCACGKAAAKDCSHHECGICCLGPCNRHGK